MSHYNLRAREEQEAKKREEEEKKEKEARKKRQMEREKERKKEEERLKKREEERKKLEREMAAAEAASKRSGFADFVNFMINFYFAFTNNYTAFSCYTVDHFATRGQLFRSRLVLIQH